jgi:hypothetical protein
MVDYFDMDEGRNLEMSDTASKMAACVAILERPCRPGLPAVAPLEIFRKISQNFSPAGVTSPFVARVMPMDTNSVVPVTRR